MGKIIRNNIVYGGTSNIAGNISYNNTSSGLNSTTVQNAITELKTLINNVPTNTTYVTTKIVEELPLITYAEQNVIYMVDSNSDGTYEKYIVVVVNNVKQYESIGSEDIDLSHYLQQKEEMPEASAEELGNIYQYIGTTSQDYTHGHIYECTSSGEPVVYSWTEVTSFDIPSEETPHFIGTSSEWNLLSEADKIAYEGGEIIFTDDNSGTGVIENTIVDTINPISAHAVYDLTQSLINAPTCKSTNRYYQGKINADGSMYFTYRRGLYFGTYTGEQSPLIVSNEVGQHSVTLEDYDGLPKEVLTMINDCVDGPNALMRYIESAYIALIPSDTDAQNPYGNIKSSVNLINIVGANTGHGDTFSVFFPEGEQMVMYRFRKLVLNYFVNPPYDNPSATTGYTGPAVLEIVFKDLNL